MSIFERMRATVLSMLMKYGQPMQLLQAGPTAYNPATSQNEAVSTGTFHGRGLLMDFSEADPAISFVKGTEIQQGDKILYVAMSAMKDGSRTLMPQPNTNDTVMLAKTPYSVEASTTLDPSGVAPIMHVSHVRGIPQDG